MGVPSLSLQVSQSIFFSNAVYAPFVSIIQCEWVHVFEKSRMGFKF